VGRILRSTSLDELPQFWNVLIGEMSLVGTRPPTADEVAQYNERHWQRLNVKPGLTGEWQVNGRLASKILKRLSIWICYQSQWSPLYDLVLIAKTIYVILPELEPRNKEARVIREERRNPVTKMVLKVLPK